MERDEESKNCKLSVTNHTMFPSGQLFKNSPNETALKVTPKAVMVGDYLQQLNFWLDRYFGKLEQMEDWRRFYIHLVGVLVNMANAQRTEETEKIDLNKIIMPKDNDLFQVCRLLYQAIVPLRTAIPDGQHRVAAMVELMGGWKIRVDTRQIPPRSFTKELTTTVQAGQFDKLLETLSHKVIARVMVPSGEHLEKESANYSRIRELSQSMHKKRALFDM